MSETSVKLYIVLMMEAARTLEKSFNFYGAATQKQFIDREIVMQSKWELMKLISGK